MNASAITMLRKALGLSQAEFSLLFGAHAMTVSKWERGVLRPSAYQLALMLQFQRAVNQTPQQAKTHVKQLLVGAGVVAALHWLLKDGDMARNMPG